MSRGVNDRSNVWFIDESIQQAQYMNKVNQAAIPGNAKDFCRYIASKATWQHTNPRVPSYQPCHAAQDTIEIQMGRSSDYVTRAKKAAQKYGWIQVQHRPGTSDRIYPCIGLEDDEIARKNEKKVREGVSWSNPEILPSGHPDRQG